MRRFAYIALGWFLLATTFAQASAITDAQPADRPMPEYPAAAINVEGHITIHFDIDASGHTENLRITRSDPPGVFDRAALSAVSRWLYHPRVRNGHSAPQVDNSVNLAFVPPEPEPIFKPTLDYPREAYAARLEGSVTIAFDIAPTGLTTNLSVVKSNPPGIFDKSALAAVSSWQYPIDPTDKTLPRQTTEITFTLADAQLAPIPLRPIRLTYPEAAQQAGIIGDCDVGFWIEENGTTSGAHILYCSPTGYFEGATLDSVKKAIYRVEAEPNLNHRRYHSICVKFRLDGFTGGEASYLKPGQWIKLRFTRTINGRAKDIAVVAQSGPGLPTDKAIEQLRDTTLTPAIDNGKPVEQPSSTMIFSGDLR